jgi:2'-5' RNA ligase
MRTFIAVKVPPTPGLRRLNARLSELGVQFKPVALGNLHLTLKFLGDTSDEQLPEICSALKRIIESSPAHNVRLTGLGAFPNVRRPTVIWVGVNQAEVLCRMAEELELGLAPLGFASEGRNFQPHLTLLRVKSRPPEQLFTLLAEEANAEFGMVPVDKIEFLQSELTRGGSRYTVLATFALAPSAMS